MPRYERPVEYDAVVIYDADCPYCSAATRALRGASDLGAVSWDADVAQSFLDAQFGEVPFAVTLVDADEDRVYLGRDAARELADRAGLPDLVGELVSEEFDRVESLVNRLGGHDRSFDGSNGRGRHGIEPLTEDARAKFDDLSYEAWTIPGR